MLRLCLFVSDTMMPSISYSEVALASFRMALRAFIVRDFLSVRSCCATLIFMEVIISNCVSILCQG